MSDSDQPKVDSENLTLEDIAARLRADLAQARAAIAMAKLQIEDERALADEAITKAQMTVFLPCEFQYLLPPLRDAIERRVGDDPISVSFNIATDVAQAIINVLNNVEFFDTLHVCKNGLSYDDYGECPNCGKIVGG